MHRFLAAGIVATLLLSAYAVLPGQEAPRNPRPARSWEYRLVLIRELHGDKGTETERVKTAESALNEYGKDGWEYAGQVSSGVLFKRSKP